MEHNLHSNIDSHLALIDEDGTILFVNSEWDKFGLENGASSLKDISKGCNYFDVCRKAIAEGNSFAEKALAGIHSVLKKEKHIFELEYPCHSPTEKRWFMLRAVSFGNKKPKVMTDHLNITVRKLAEEKMLHAIRLYKFISQINQTITHVHDEETVFKEACKIAIELGRFEAAWIGVIDTVNKKINFVEGYGIADEDLPKFKNASYEINGPQCYVVSKQEPYICNDIQNDFESVSSKALAKKRNYASVMVLPIFKSGKLFATFNLYSSELNFFDIAEIKLLKEATGDISFALDVFEKEHLKSLAEQKLEVSELNYRQIVETAQEGIWLLDEYNKTTFVNQKLCDILGYTREEMIGKKNFFFMDKTGKAVAKESLKRRKNGVKETLELRYITKEGKHIWASVSANPIFGINGNYKGALGMLSDITDKKILERLLEKVNQAARIGNWEIDFLKKKVILSAMVKEIHQFSKTFTPNFKSPFSYYKSDESKKALELAIASAKKNGTHWDLELQLITTNGNIIWVRNIGETEFINGKCVKIVGSLQDINQRKIAEINGLKALEEKNNILESIGDAFFAVDKKWVLTYFNKKAEELLGLKKTEVIGKNLWDIFPESVNSRSYKKYHWALEKKKSIVFEDHYPLLNKWYQATAYPSLIGLSVYIKDITKQKNSQIERALMISDIIQRNKDLEQFSYIISHNLRAPIAHILGLSGLLEKNTLSQTDKLKTEAYLFSATKQLDMVITDLNLILQVRQNIEEKKETILFSELVNTIKVSISNLIEKEKVQIITRFSEVDQLYSVKTYLYSIFYNLISNSIKYSQANTAPIIIITSKKIKEKIILSFEDNGMGLDLEKHGDKVFGLYRRFHSEAEGKGMGLYMVKMQVEILGGTISITSHVNQGTTFIIEFNT